MLPNGTLWDGWVILGCLGVILSLAAFWRSARYMRIALVVGLISGLAGVVMLREGWRELQFSRKAVETPVIVYSSALEVQKKNGHVKSVHKLVYSYTVRGKAYVGRVAEMDPIIGQPSEEDIWARVNRIGIGPGIGYVDAQEPQISMLTRQTYFEKWISYGIMASGFYLIILGGLLKRQRMAGAERLKEKIIQENERRRAIDGDNSI